MEIHVGLGGQLSPDDLAYHELVIDEENSDRVLRELRRAIGGHVETY
jgi:hypothetical protein